MQKPLILLVLACYCTASSIRKSLELVPGNLKDVASFVSPSVTITQSLIRAGPAGKNREKLIEVPIGTIEASSTVSVTVGLENAHFNTKGVDADLLIRITDGTVNYGVWIVDINNYNGLAPCYAVNMQNREKKVQPGTRVPSQFKITFHPTQQFGYCETAQDGGYINVFNEAENMDLSKPLFLELLCDGSYEVYPMYYISVDVF